MNTSAIVHPQIQALFRECEDLRLQLSHLLEQQAMLEEHTRSYLEAIYLEALGHLEFSLLQVQAENALLRRRLELGRAVINRGKCLNETTRRQIDCQLELEWSGWKQRLATEERRLDEAKIRLTVPLLSETATHKLKLLYRKTVRRIHPDATGIETSAYQKYWNEVQQAYRNGDMDYLEILYETICRETWTPNESGLPIIEETEREHRRLIGLLKTQVDRLARIRSTPPLSHEAQLRDPEWVNGKQLELQAAINREEKSRRQLMVALNELFPGHAPLEPPALH